MSGGDGDMPDATADELAESKMMEIAERREAIISHLREMAQMSDQELKDVPELHFRRAILNTFL